MSNVPAGSSRNPESIPTKAQEEVKDYIWAEREKGNVVVMGIEGLMSMPMEEFVKQPADGILYDLNRLEEVVATFFHDRKWVNDFAVALTIRKLVAQRDEARQAEIEQRNLAGSLLHERDELLSVKLPSEKAKPEWVRCGEAKPNVYDSILLTDGVERITGFLCPSGEWARHDGGEWNPTHWMQLPACPERNCEGKS